MCMIRVVILFFFVFLSIPRNSSIPSTASLFITTNLNKKKGELMVTLQAFKWIFVTAVLEIIMSIRMPNRICFSWAKTLEESRRVAFSDYHLDA